MTLLGQGVGLGDPQRSRPCCDSVNKPAVDCLLSSSFLCAPVASIATACELKLQEHPRATASSSSVERRGAAHTCDKLRAPPKALQSERQRWAEQLGAGMQRGDAAGLWR